MMRPRIPPGRSRALCVPWRQRRDHRPLRCPRTRRRRSLQSTAGCDHGSPFPAIEILGCQLKIDAIENCVLAASRVEMLHPAVKVRMLAPVVERRGPRNFKVDRRGSMTPVRAQQLLRPSALQAVDPQDRGVADPSIAPSTRCFFSQEFVAACTIDLAQAE